MSAAPQAAPVARRWEGATAVCIASGPSLTAEDVERVRAARERGACLAIAVNREFATAPWADALYAADMRFWSTYEAQIRSTFKGELWTMDRIAAKRYALRTVKRGRGEGYCEEPGTINTGGNSGFQALHLAAQWGARRVVLLGYDMQRTNGKEHHYGKHAGGLANGAGFKLWIPRFKPLLRDLQAMGVEVLNATRATALPEAWVRRIALEEVL